LNADSAEFPELHDAAITALLEALYRRYHCDFRDYARSSLRRRLAVALRQFRSSGLEELQERVLADPSECGRLLEILTIQVSEFFRDPGYFQAFRERVVPYLRTYPSIKIWVAGCSSGEEVYSLAIVLHEEGVLERSLIYATDINPSALRIAERGIYELGRIAGATRSYQQSGATGSLSDYYSAAYENAVFASWLRARIVFADHSLSTDTVFSEVQFVTCRNVLIYFNRALQDRALGIFNEALCPRGFLGLGSRESLRFSTHSAQFSDFDPAHRIYRRLA
jgi:chemotaxis protein methyltransferase CheR